MTTILTALLVLLLFALSALLLVVYRLRRAVATLTHDLAEAQALAASRRIAMDRLAKEADRLERGLVLFAIRPNWTMDERRNDRPAFKGRDPWEKARKALAHRWQPGKSEVTP